MICLLFFSHIVLFLWHILLVWIKHRLLVQCSLYPPKLNIIRDLTFLESQYSKKSVMVRSGQFDYSSFFGDGPVWFGVVFTEFLQFGLWVLPQCILYLSGMWPLVEINSSESWIFIIGYFVPFIRISTYRTKKLDWLISFRVTVNRLEKN